MVPPSLGDSTVRQKGTSCAAVTDSSEGTQDRFGGATHQEQNHLGGLYRGDKMTHSYVTPAPDSLPSAAPVAHEPPSTPTRPTQTSPSKRESEMYNKHNEEIQLKM